MKCSEFKHTKDDRGNLIKISYEACVENAFIWLDVSEILCIYRVFSDEKEGEADVAD